MKGGNFTTKGGNFTTRSGNIKLECFHFKCYNKLGGMFYFCSFHFY